MGRFCHQVYKASSLADSGWPSIREDDSRVHMHLNPDSSMTCRAVQLIMSLHVVDDPNLDDDRGPAAGRPGVPPERLLKAMLLQALYSI